MTGILNNKDIYRDTLLGHMAFYYMPGVKLEQTALEDLFAQNNLSANYLPAKIHGHDAFRRVTSSVVTNGHITITDRNNFQYNAKLNIDEVRSDQDYIVRTLGRKIIDPVNDNVEYATVGRIKYDRSIESVTVYPEHEYAREYDYENNILNPISSQFREAVQYHNKDTVRSIINRVFKNLQPVTIIKGAYFIPKTYETEILNLQGAIQGLEMYATDPSEKPDMKLIPLLDTAEQRDMIHSKASEELIKDTDSLVKELTDALLANKETKDMTILRLNAELLALKEKASEYSALLDVKLSNAAQLFQHAIQLFCQVKDNSVLKSDTRDVLNRTDLLLA